MVCALIALTSALLIGQEPEAAIWPPPSAEGALWSESRPAPGRPFVRSGERCLVAGTEGGPLEVWTLPFQVVRNVRFSVRLQDGTRLLPEDYFAASGTGADLVGEYYEMGVAGRLVRTITVSPDKPVAVVEFAGANLKGATIELTLDPSLRLSWPASSAGIVPDMDNRANDFAIIGNTNTDGPQIWGAIVASEPLRPLRREGFEHAYSAALPDDAPLRIAFAGSEDKWSKASDLATETLRSLDLTAREAEKRRNAVLDQCVIETGDAEVNDAARWAKLALAASVVDVPGVGRGFVGGLGPQGYCSSPGFAQFDARASTWACRAAGAIGLRDACAGSLELMREHQARDGDLAGLVPVLVSPAHKHVDTESRGYRYEGADPTADYVLALWRTWRWTGDDGLVRKHGDALRLAAERLEATDYAAVEALSEMADVAGLTEWSDTAPARAGTPEPEPYAALEAFRSGSPDDGWKLLQAIANESRDGAFAGASDGAPDEEPYSTANAAAFLVTLIEGLLGIEPDAPHAALTIRPRLPAGMDRVSVRVLPVGEHVVDIEILAGEKVTVRHEGRTPLTFTLVTDSGETTVEVKGEAEIPYP